MYNTVIDGTSNPNFTGDTQDTISGEFDTHYRQLHPSQGRWISPDPAGLRAVDPMNPQTWNRYMYVRNNPLSWADPSGLDTDSSGLNIDWGFNWQFPITFNGVNAPQMFTFLGGANYGTFYSTSTASPPPSQGQAAVDAGLYFSPNGTCLNLIGLAANCGTPTPRPCQFGRGYMAFCAGSHGPANRFTLGIRAPGQTWKRCMAANANTYSIGGSIELAANVATGTNTSYSSNPLVSGVTGNAINTFVFGSTEAAATMGANAPGLVSTATGAATTFGRRTTTIMWLNLAGVPGGPPLVLSQASAGIKVVLGKIGDALSFGLSVAERTAVDVGFTGAEVINCAIPQ